MEKRNIVKISKFLSGLLRHFPDSFGIKIDEAGWADLEEVSKVVENKYSIKNSIDIIKKIVENDEKGRFEINKNKIRAKYGHTINVDVNWSESERIPSILYHGTSKKALKSILQRGLLPMKRKEVHLSENIQNATEVGKRYDNNPVILTIDAKRMIEDGYKIRKKGKVYTTDFVPPNYIKVKKLKTDK